MMRRDLMDRDDERENRDSGKYPPQSQPPGGVTGAACREWRSPCLLTGASSAPRLVAVGGVRRIGRVSQATYL